MILPNGISITATDSDTQIVQETLALLPPEFLAWISLARIDIRVLERGEKFADVGKYYATNDTIDYGVCEGLYCMSERQVIIASNRPAVISHELFHVCDFLAGNGEKMRSQIDDRVLKAYRRHDPKRGGDGMYISAYAGYNSTEFVAEFGRAALGFSEQPPGRPHDLERLKRIDPELVVLVQDWLDEIKTHPLLKLESV